MAIPFLNNIDLNLNQIQNFLVHPLASDPGSPVEGQAWYNTTTHLLKYFDGTTTVILYRGLSTATASTFVLRDGSGDFAAHDITANKVTGLVAPVADSDAASKSYVDSLSQGLDWKASVRVATTANVDLASAPAAIDGVTLAASDRVLVKSQTDAGDNGIYVFAATSSPMTRASDANTSAEVTGGLATWVNEGTAHGDTGWVLSTNDAVVLGTTDLTFTQFSSTVVNAGDGLTKTGNTIDVVTASSARIVVSADSIDLATTTVTPGTYSSITVDAYGRATAGADIITSNGIVVRTAAATFTNRSVAAGTGISVSNADGVAGNPTVAIDASVVVKKYAADIGDGSSATLTVTHNLGTRDVVVGIRDNNAPYDFVMVDVEATDTNTVTVTFAVAPASARYRCIVKA